MPDDNNEKLVPPNDSSNGEAASIEEAAPAEAVKSPRRKARKPAQDNQAAEEVLGLLSDVAEDIRTNEKSIAGLVVICSWKDGTLTQGWTGNFDLDQTSGKLFNIATQFTLNSIRIKSMN